MKRVLLIAMAVISCLLFTACNQKSAEEIDALKQKNQELSDQISNLESQIKKLQEKEQSDDNSTAQQTTFYTTSVYQSYLKWLDAQASSETGDLYEVLLLAREQIRDGLDSGKTGTKKYQESVNLLVPTKERDNIKDYMKTVDNYLDANYRGVWKFADDLVSIDIMEKEGEQYTYWADITSQQKSKACSSLNIMPVLFEALIGELNEYDFSFRLK